MRESLELPGIFAFEGLQTWLSGWSGAGERAGENPVVSDLILKEKDDMISAQLCPGRFHPVPGN